MGGLGPDGLDLESRAAYLKGLASGLGLAESEQGRLLVEIVDLIADLTREMTQRLPAPLAAGEATREPGSSPLFLACDCPECGEDVFVETESLPGGQPGEHLAACPNCGKGLLISETAVESLLGREGSATGEPRVARPEAASRPGAAPRGERRGSFVREFRRPSRPRGRS